MKALYFIISNLALLWIVRCWACSVARHPQDFLFAVGALYPVSAALVVMLAGLSGHLRPLPVTVGLLLLAVTVSLVASAAPQRDAVNSPPKTFASRCAAGAVIAFLSIPLLRVFTAGTGYFIDDFGYHAVAVASWIQQARIEQIMPQFMAYLPLNAELLAAWFALPWHNDTMVVVAGVIWLGLAAFSARRLVLECGGDATAGMLSAVAVLAAPPLAWQTRTFAAVDLAGAAALLTAIYFVARAVQTERLALALLAGMLGGFAAGAKATFIPVTALICIAPLFTRLALRRRAALILLLVLAAAALGSTWYLRNWIIAGNPLFPATVGPFTGPLTRDEQGQTTLLGLLMHVPSTYRLWSSLVYDYLNWPLPLGLLACAGYVRVIAVEWMWLRHPSGLKRPPLSAEGDGAADVFLRRLLFIGGLTQFALHFFAPFCLGGGYVDGRIEVYSRYIMPWFLFGLVLAGPLLSGGVAVCSAARLLLVAGLALAFPREGLMPFALAVLALAGVLALHYLPGGARARLAMFACMSILPVLALAAAKLRGATEKNLSTYLQTAGGKSLGKALRSLESLPPGTKVARFAQHAYLNSPFFGRDWQLLPIFTDGHGRPLPPLHLQFQRDPALHLLYPSAESLPTPVELTRNLSAAGVSDVFVTKYDNSAWPPQEALFEANPEWTRVFDDGDSVLWHLSPGSP